MAAETLASRSPSELPFRIDWDGPGLASGTQADSGPTVTPTGAYNLAVGVPPGPAHPGLAGLGVRHEQIDPDVGDHGRPAVEASSPGPAAHQIVGDRTGRARPRRSALGPRLSR